MIILNFVGLNHDVTCLIFFPVLFLFFIFLVISSLYLQPVANCW
ncbi:hypothetical protein SLEP1_g11661 [Rubroshorea leprosula]|nr:hypothetical protein SLEP1_g11661 [Rubroshorea leprosula]